MCHQIHCECHAKCNYSPTGFPSVIISVTDQPPHTHTHTHYFSSFSPSHLNIQRKKKCCSECIKKEHCCAKTRTYNIFYFAKHLLCFSRLSSRLTREHLNIRICICDPLQVHPIRQHTVLLIHRHTPEKTSGRQVDFKPTWLQSQEILHFEERCLCLTSFQTYWSFGAIYIIYDGNLDLHQYTHYFSLFFST